MIPTGFHRVRRSERCPVCAKPDWCLIANDGKSAICARVESPDRWKEAGWKHQLDSPLPAFKPKAKTEPMAVIDAPSILRAFMQDTTTARLATLADELGVSIETLRRVGACWAAVHDAWAFPMRSASGVPVGIRLRTMSGKKFAVKGSRDGIFIPNDLAGEGPLLICEGPTDAAAILDIGFDVIGRPSCMGAVKHTADFLRGKKRDAVIVADADGPGLRGAQSLANELPCAVRIIAPPRHKDARAWINAGGTRRAFECVIAASRYVRKVER